MRITGDRKIQVSEGETLTLQSTTANLSLLAQQADAGQELKIKFPLVNGTHQLRALSIGVGNLTIRSRSGQEWTTKLLAGPNLFNFLVEPVPDVWYCENDDGEPPPHPVSKGATVCEFCGGKIIYGSS